MFWYKHKPRYWHNMDSWIYICMSAVYLLNHSGNVSSEMHLVDFVILWGSVSSFPLDLVELSKPALLRVWSEHLCDCHSISPACSLSVKKPWLRPVAHHLLTLSWSPASELSHNLPCRPPPPLLLRWFPILPFRSAGTSLSWLAADVK